MADSDPQEGNKVHKLESKKAPVLLSKTVRSEESDTLGGIASLSLKEEVQDVQELVEEAWDKKGGKPSRWFLLSLYVLVGVVTVAGVWAIVLLSQQAEMSVAAPREKEAMSYAEKQALRLEVIQSYLAASTVAEKALYVRDAARVLPLMEAYYSKYPMQPESLSGQVIESPVMGKEGVMWRVKVREGEAEALSYIYVESSDDGSALVDWETDVIYQPSDWGAFTDERSTKPHTFRAFVQAAQLDGFHGFEFSEYNKYRCFKVTLPGSDDYLWAYTEIGSALDAQLVNVVSGGGRRSVNSKRKVPVILSLSYPEGALSPRCVHLTELLQIGWMK
ncbi:hypothetical protein [Rubritalea tangerina]|uniref:SUN domain-containing protein n=1 Tax=Rubritalea tangerina TaxID=430798 RepID=A0ABW4Z8E4_9BACT